MQIKQKNSINGFLVLTLLVVIISILIITACTKTIQTTKCNYNDPSKRYIGKSVSECSVIKFVCKSNEEYFSDECGCGCKLKESIKEPVKDDILRFLCTPSNETGTFEREVRISSNGNYYQLTYGRDIKAIDESTGKVNVVRSPAIDFPTIYYDKTATLISSCGGYKKLPEPSFCTEILPTLSFNKNDLCKDIR